VCRVVYCDQVKWLRRFVSTLLHQVDVGVRGEWIACFEVPRQCALNRLISDHMAGADYLHHGGTYLLACCVVQLFCKIPFHDASIMMKAHDIRASLTVHADLHKDARCLEACPIAGLFYYDNS
jgi:hypothetical protein